MGTALKSLPAIHPELATDILVRFLREESEKFGFARGVLGLSGGIDSAVSCALAARAFGPENVLAVVMPYRTSAPESRAHALECVEVFGTRVREIDISPMADPYLADIPDDDRVRRGNVMARLRMTVLYDLSAPENALVIGTSNKTELLLGYSTLHGDSASALNPLGDLYKTQVRQLAEYLDVPEAVRDKAPSADLWEGQTDEQELGFTYAEVDALLHLQVDRRLTDGELAGRGFDPAFAERVRSMVARNQYKRRPPIIAKLSNRTVNVDFRYLRDWRH